MINLTTIINALKVQLEADSTFAGLFPKGIFIEQFINMDAAEAPWACIYPNGVTYTPRTLGRGMDNWEGTPSLRLVLQASHINNAEECATLLNSYLTACLDAITTDLTIGGTINIIDEYTVDYKYLMDERSEVHFKAAELVLNMRKKTS